MSQLVDGDITAAQRVDDEVFAGLQMLLSEVLGVSKVSPNDNFFELGGDSLQMMTFLFRISEYLHELREKAPDKANDILVSHLMSHIHKGNGGE
jgi:aryl carrier-like protein